MFSSNHLHTTRQPRCPLAGNSVHLKRFRCASQWIVLPKIIETIIATLPYHTLLCAIYPFICSCESSETIRTTWVSTFLRAHSHSVEKQKKKPAKVEECEMTVTLGSNYRKYVRLISLSLTFTPSTIYVRVVSPRKSRLRSLDVSAQKKAKENPHQKQNIELWMIDLRFTVDGTYSICKRLIF